VERLPRWRRRRVQLKRVQVRIEGDVVPCARYSGAVGDAVAQGLPVVGDANKDSLDACKAEALVVEVTTFLIDACECAVWRDSCDIGLLPEEYLVDSLGAVGARRCRHVNSGR